ncbi:MAG: hypothetical protein CVU10_01970 [Bacteroidetes bacterium HGW-Bacteroidetes-5]|jgi:hypothetical protein|nr:MAG: hypothetical protein CVU10_01970 [Bacteroidetes bacterium HGW-Bacteroidetes-5]
MKTKFFFLLVAILTITFNAEAKSSASSDLSNPKMDATALVQRALKQISVNYPKSDNQMNAFYKERLTKNSDCLSVNEAILDINKRSYITPKTDQVAVRDARGNCDTKLMNPLLIKLQGGPVTSLQLDVIKYPFLGSDIYNIGDNYDFEFSKPTEIAGKKFYVVNFNQKYADGEMLFRGKLYIESQSLAIAKVEYSMNVENRGWAYTRFFKSRPKHSDVKMISADYVVNYREYDNKWYFDYSTSNITFNILNKVESTYDVYNVNSQLAVTNLVAEGFTIDKKDLLKSTDILADKIGDYKIASEWDVYNLIMLLAINY